MDEAEGKKLIAVGYWYDERCGHRSAGLDPKDFVDPSWDPQERARVLAYLRAGRVRRRWRGVSWCRARHGCGQGLDMGSADLTDDVYVWPQGYAHYVEKHDVRPPEGFVHHILSRGG